MSNWSFTELQQRVFTFDVLSEKKQKTLTAFLNQSYTPETVEKQLVFRRRALENTRKSKTILTHAIQHYPECLSSEAIRGSAGDLRGYAILLMAGGDGERLRESLEKKGYSKELEDFTKATFPLPNFFKTFGTLSVNLALISKLCQDYSIDIPVVVTTGPCGSTTSKVIPPLVRSFQNFGLKNCTIISQDSRIHFTQENQIVPRFCNDAATVITNPDETGGPIMKLKSRDKSSSKSIIEWLVNHGCQKIIILQATALYDPQILVKMATCGKNYDGVGIGIQRNVFPSDDPYGTYVVLEENNNKKLVIIESEIRNATTVSLKDPTGAFSLPYNTGLYVLDLELIQNNHLPDYATPPKTIISDLPKSPKIGYAATDWISFAKKPAVLTIPNNSYGVLKHFKDLENLSKIGKRFNLHTMCEEIYASIF